jgi:hypothetical protein
MQGIIISQTFPLCVVMPVNENEFVVFFYQIINSDRLSFHPAVLERKI